MKLEKCAQRLAAIAELIEAVENRCMAADGPVTPTTKEITEAELRTIYRLATGEGRAKLRRARPAGKVLGTASACMKRGRLVLVCPDSSEHWCPYATDKRQPDCRRVEVRERKGGGR